VPIIVKSAEAARVGKWLAGAGTGPDGAVIGPAGEAQGKRPSADAGEEVAAGVSFKVGRSNIDNCSLVNIAWWQVACGDEVADPLCCERVNLIVIVAGHVIPRPSV
jgi:hypothetical protein